MKIQSSIALCLSFFSSLAFASNLDFSGDVRIRVHHDKQAGAQPDSRKRFRARTGVKATVTETLKAGIFLTTGSSATSPNQDMDSGFSRKGFNIGQAYFDWSGLTSDLHIIAGKQKNPFFQAGKNQLIWDNDLRPEGTAVTYSSEAIPVFANMGIFVPNYASTGQDSWLLGGQVGVDLSIASGEMKFVGGAGYYQYTNTLGTTAYTGSFKGNSNDGTNYANAFRMIEAFLEVQMKAVNGKPLSVFGNFVLNAGAPTSNTGWIAGVGFGKSKETGTFSLSYDYRRIEADAVVADFNDSDFKGGGTNASGHTFKAGYQISNPFKVQAAYYLAQNGLVNGQGFHTAQFDFIVTF